MINNVSPSINSTSFGGMLKIRHEAIKGLVNSNDFAPFIKTMENVKQNVSDVVSFSIKTARKGFKGGYYVNGDINLDKKYFKNYGLYPRQMARIYGGNKLTNSRINLRGVGFEDIEKLITEQANSLKENFDSTMVAFSDYKRMNKLKSKGLSEKFKSFASSVKKIFQKTEIPEEPKA